MRKLLIANRGEIAIRAARAARELGVTSVAMYSAEDRSGLHRLIADEAYQIGEAGHPVRTYLDIPKIIEIAHRSGADAVYPGYGFLSRVGGLRAGRDRCRADLGGPDAGDARADGRQGARPRVGRTRGRSRARRLRPRRLPQEALAEAERIGYPVFIKASGGGGGRGLRKVETAEEATLVFDAARREAAAAFGDDTLFVEQAVIRPRHVEVQVLADGDGNVVHLYERDCSVQRRHQKVVEIAPAPGLPRELVARLCADAVGFAREVHYRAAGTVEFLVWTDPQARAESHESGYGYAFIEMNPRIQVEHTVTEEVTGIDLVLSQLRIARGESLADLGIAQEGISVQRSAIQCRLTTEDPADEFRPATGTIVVYRSPGGPGVRLDGATYAGADVTPFYDSLLVKLTTSGADFTSAARRARRALSEFQVRGVATNVSFLRALLSDPDFLSGDLTTAFLDEHPDLVSAQPGSTLGAAAGLLTRLAEVDGQPAQWRVPRLRARAREPAAGRRRRHAHPSMHRQAGARRERPRVARRVAARTRARRRHRHDPARRPPVAPRDARAQQGPRVGGPCPGRPAAGPVQPRVLGRGHLRRRAALPRRRPLGAARAAARGGAGRADPDAHPRAATRSATRPIPRTSSPAFVAEAREVGMDVFRVFDALNSVEKTRPVIDAVRDACGLRGGRHLLHLRRARPAEATYTLDYYLRDRRRVRGGGRARPGDQGHGRPAPATGRDGARAGPAQPFRRARPPAHARHRRRASWPPTSPRSRRASTASTAPRRRWRRAAASPAWGRCWRPPPHADRDPGLAADSISPTPRGSSRTGRPSATSTRPSRPGQRSPATSVYRYEVPGRAAVEPARPGRRTRASAIASPTSSRPTTMPTSCWAGR